MEVTAGPGGNVHDYVPFYFSSVNPMLLSKLLQKNVDQILIIYFGVKIQRLDEEDVVFTNASANTNDAPTFFSDTSDLNQLDWSIIDKRQWGKWTNEEKHKKMAEALIHHRVDMADIDCIVVWNESVKKEVERILKDNNVVSPPIVFDGNDKIKNYKFYYTKFFIPGQKNHTLVTGPQELLSNFQCLLKTIIEKRKGRANFTYLTIGELIIALDEDFSILPELKELADVHQNYPPHNDTVKNHTKQVVSAIKRQAYYHKTTAERKAILVLAAYLHDMGKGPKTKWVNGIMSRAYPDHPADAIPMLERILTEEVAILSDEDIRQICMLVVYHDIVGECMERGRDKEQIARVITNDEDLEMLFAIALADAEAIHPEWAESIALGKEILCQEVREIKNKLL